MILFNITIQYNITLQGIRLTYTNNNSLIHLRLLHTLLTLFTILVTFLLHFAHLLLSLLINIIIITIIFKKNQLLPSNLHLFDLKKKEKKECFSDSPSNAVTRCTFAPANCTGEAEQSFTQLGEMRHFTQCCLQSASY